MNAFGLRMTRRAGIVLGLVWTIVACGDSQPSLGYNTPAAGAAGMLSDEDEGQAGAPSLGAGGTSEQTATGGSGTTESEESFTLTSEASIELVGAERIVRCPENSPEPETNVIDYFSFRQFSDAELLEWLQSTPAQLIPGVISSAVAEDQGDFYSLDFGSGTASIYKSTGMFTLSPRADTADDRILPDTATAVDEALRQIQEAQLVETPAQQQLCVRSVSTTMAGVTTATGGATGDATVMSYRILFGRSLFEDPVYGGYFAVDISPRGQITSVERRWRVVAPDSTTTFTVLDPGEVQDARNQDFLENLPLNFVQCGYYELTSNDAMEAPAVGCHYQYADASAGGEMQEPVRDDWINLSPNGQPALP